jgi:hypothetical protein
VRLFVLVSRLLVVRLFVLVSRLLVLNVRLL